LALTEVKMKKIIVMRSHEGGLVTFGKDLQEALGVLMDARTENVIGEK